VVRRIGQVIALVVETAVIMILVGALMPTPCSVYRNSSMQEVPQRCVLPLLTEGN
jgi:hypothetical protein